MRLNAFRGWWKRRGVDPDAELLNELHSPDRFRAILEVERMRVDRAGGRFALATFSFSADAHQEFLLFAQYVRSRVRATDHAGLLGERQIGVLLWSTDADGARQFVDSLARAEHSWTRPECVIYEYPEGDAHVGRPKETTREAELLERVDAVVASLGRPLAGAHPKETREACPAGMYRFSELFVRPLPAWKRAMDIVGAGFGLLMLSPLLAATAIAIKLTSPGPVLFVQRRSGLGGRPFTIYKFRTMRVTAEQEKAQLRAHSEQDGPAFKMTRDPRVTWLGRYLRKTCIDELPQLWNVLKGDMTLVGPRPLPCDEQAGCAVWQSRRLDVTPGLTCIWQVHGKSKVSFAEWMRMDIRYIQARTLLQDLRLICETVCAVVLHRGSC
jgi:lipopolysaccharide/colanic/teichoic acid biosynthesis glycosyltransferase